MYGQLCPVDTSHQISWLSNDLSILKFIVDEVECRSLVSSASWAWSILKTLSFIAGPLSITDSDGRDSASATKFVSPLTYLMSVVNSAMKDKCRVWRRDARSVTDDITNVKGLWSVFTKKLRPSRLCLKCFMVAYTAKSSRSNAL